MQSDAGPLSAGSPPQALKDYLRRHVRLTRDDVAWICGISEHLLIRRGTPFDTAGQAGCGCGFLLDGVLQSYGVSPHGQRVVLDLIFPGTLAPPPTAAGQGGLAGACVEAVTTCTLRFWPGELCRTVLDRHAGWQRLRLRVVEEALLHGHQRYLTARMLTAEERYARMAGELPQEWQRLPQRLIASYLGITPQYLSLIRRKQRNAAAGRTDSRHGAA